MACGIAHTEWSNTQNFIDAVACGKKFENPHFQHYCMVCDNRGSEVCESECFYGTVCHFAKEDPNLARETVSAVLLAIHDVLQDLAAERGEPAEVAASTGPCMVGIALEG